MRSEFRVTPLAKSTVTAECLVCREWGPRIYASHVRAVAAVLRHRLEHRLAA
jgi:hypothetical protein